MSRRVFRDRHEVLMTTVAAFVMVVLARELSARVLLPALDLEERAVLGLSLAAAAAAAVLGCRIVIVAYRGYVVDSEARHVYCPRFLVCRGRVEFDVIEYYYLEEKVSYRGSATGGGSPTKLTRHRVVLVTDARKVTVQFSRRDMQQAFAEHLEAEAGVARRARNGRRLPRQGTRRKKGSAKTPA